RQRRAVDRHHRPGAERGAALMNGPRDLLLPGAGLTLDQHGRGGVGDILDQLEDRVHTRALADDVLERKLFLELVAELDHFVLELPLAWGPVHTSRSWSMSTGLGRKS